MNILQNLKIDTRRKGVLMIGIGFISISCITTIGFITNRYLFGLGLGCILIGIGHFIAWKDYSYIKPANAYTGGAGLMSGKVMIHNAISKIVISLGILLGTAFLILTVKDLLLP